MGENEDSGLLFTDELILCDESEEDLGVMLGRFSEMCIKKD